MIQIKRNKFLTKIINNDYVSSIPTKVFDEITGVNDLEYAKGLIEAKNIEESEVDLYERIKSYRDNPTPQKIFIDENLLSFKKVLESWDLTYDMLCSAIKNATIFSIAEGIQCDNYSYIGGVGEIATLYIRRNAAFNPKEFFPQFTHINRSMTNPRHCRLIGERLLTTSLSFETAKFRFGESGESININTPDERLIENLIDTTDKIYLNFSLFYNDEEWYFQELSRESIEKILSKCREFAQSIATNPPDTIALVKIFTTLWHQSIQGIKSGTIVLQDIFGRKKMFAIKDLIPKPKYLLQQHMGKYLSTRTSKWKEDVSNYIL